MTSNHNSHEFSRRSFLKATACLTLGSLAAGHSLAATLIEKGSIALVVSPDDVLATAVPPRWALGELKTALEDQGAIVRIIGKVAEATAREFCVVVAGMNSPLAQTIVRRQKISAPTEAESLCLVQSETDGRTVLLAAGTDALGLVYALTELADRVSCLASGRTALEFAEPVIERPASRTRSVMRGFCSDVEDKAWFYDRDFWRSYLTMLVTSRLNRLSLTMGMGYNSADGVTDGYLMFPYPFFVAVPGCDVRAKNLSDEERTRNLPTLKFIGEEFNSHTINSFSVRMGRPGRVGMPAGTGRTFKIPKCSSALGRRDATDTIDNSTMGCNPTVRKWDAVVNCDAVGAHYYLPNQ